jgi:hypothetical protein
MELLVSSVLEMMEKEADVAELHALFLYFPAGTRKNHKHSYPLYLMQGLYFV